MDTSSHFIRMACLLGTLCLALTGCGKPKVVEHEDIRPVRTITAGRTAPSSAAIGPGPGLVSGSSIPASEPSPQSLANSSFESQNLVRSTSSLIGAHDFHL